MVKSACLLIMVLFFCGNPFIATGQQPQYDVRPGNFLDRMDSEDSDRIKALSKYAQTYVKARLKDGSAAKYILPKKMKVGDIGILKRSIGFQVDRIIDDNTMLIHGNKIWLEGYDTRQTRENRAIRLDRFVVTVLGTKEYSTEKGDELSVAHLVAFDPTKAHQAIASIVAKQGHRLWTTHGGKQTHVAKFIRRLGNYVRIQMTNGSIRTIAFRHFSAADQQWLLSHRAMPRHRGTAN